jgi:serine-type D-Ala-D-Ala carboxypeptidase (penicillin-binding protein 5/6)
LLLIGLLIALLPAPAGAAPAAPPAVAQSLATPPDVTARAAVLIDAASGTVLYEKSAHDHLPPASLTKMATALVAVERADPSRIIEATERSQVEPVTIGMEPGDQLPLVEALYGLLLNSGNDAALAIAETVGDGSIDQFIGWMNELVESLGLLDTHFANPHGLDYGDHYSSAYDLAIIGRELLEQPLLKSIVATPRHLYSGPPLWAFRNINPLLTTYAGADGIKTGYETRAGHCIAASATRDGRQVIAVVLNSPRYTVESAALLDWGFAELERRANLAASTGRTELVGPLGRPIGSLTASPPWPNERAWLRGRLGSDLADLASGSLVVPGRAAYARLRAALAGSN